MIKGSVEDIIEALKDAKGIVVYGMTGSGKTSLVWKIISLIDAGREVYFVAYPKPLLLQPFGYNNLQDLEDLEKIQDAIVYIDEPQLLLDISENKMERVLSKLLSIARQRDLLLIFSTSDTRLLSPRIEEYLDTWFIKGCDYSMTKQRSKIRRIIQKNSFISPEAFTMTKNEFLFHSPVKHLNGKYTYNEIPEFNDFLSKPYKDIRYNEIKNDTDNKDIRYNGNKNEADTSLSPKKGKTRETHQTGKEISLSFQDENKIGKPNKSKKLTLQEIENEVVKNE